MALAAEKAVDGRVKPGHDGEVMRSWLFVPGDSEGKLAKAAGAGADALIFDLEDSVALTRKGEARGMVAAALRGAREVPVYVRINPLGSGMALEDLAAVMGGAPDGIVLPKPDGGADVQTLAFYLDAFEAAFGVPAGRTRILPIATETAKSLFTVNSYEGPRLAGLTWGAEDLPAAVGAASGRGRGWRADRFVPAGAGALSGRGGGGRGAGG